MFQIDAQTTRTCIFSIHGEHACKDGLPSHSCEV
jgi:hypothetical protein